MPARMKAADLKRLSITPSGHESAAKSRAVFDAANNAERPDKNGATSVDGNAVNILHGQKLSQQQAELAATLRSLFETIGGTRRCHQPCQTIPGVFHVSHDQEIANLKSQFDNLSRGPSKANEHHHMNCGDMPPLKTRTCPHTFSYDLRYSSIQNRTHLRELGLRPRFLPLETRNSRVDTFTVTIPGANISDDPIFPYEAFVIVRTNRSSADGSDNSFQWRGDKISGEACE